ncbi:MAG: DUF547 domain-containing protein [Planctomycetes bacterium]|nr:DUF547 domain-containing protein [Planctomycetota bacterium]
MRKITLALAVVVLFAGGGLAYWKFRPAEKVVVKLTDKDLRKGDAFPHEMWSAILKKYSKDGFVNYKALHTDHADLDAYLGFVAKYSPQTHPDLFPKREDQLAYAINAYNAYVVKAVSSQDPIEGVGSALSRSKFFNGTTYPFGGKDSSLTDWEKWVRETFNEPRVHFALNCASLGCPRLPAEAFEPARLEEQLAREAKKFVNEERNVKVEGGKVKLSSIFKWYLQDFVGKDGKKSDLPAKIKEFGREAPAGEVEFVDYDWGVNELK